MQNSIQEFKENEPDLYRQVFDLGKTEGAKASVDRFNQVKDVCGDDSELVCICFAAGFDNKQSQISLLKGLSDEQLKTAFRARQGLASEFASEAAFLAYVNGLKNGTVTA